MKAIIVIPSDLDRQELSYIIAGPNTRRVCDRAVSLVRRDPDSVVIVTAGFASRKWGSVSIPNIVERYLYSVCDLPDSIIDQTSKSGLNRGMKRVSEILSGTGARTIYEIPNISEVVIVARWWQTPIAMVLCSYWLRKVGLGKLKVSIGRSEPKPGPLVKIRSRVWGLPETLIRSIFGV